MRSEITYYFIYYYYRAPQNSLLTHIQYLMTVYANY